MTSLLFPRETLLHVVKSLPAAPQILARLGQMRLDPVADLNDVTALLRCDASLTARIIRIANTAAYATGEPYASLEQALARIGFGEIYRIAGFAAVSQMSGYSLREYGISGAQLRENSLLVALLMERLAALAGADAQEAYSAGLLRSIGKMAVQGFLNGAKGKGAFDPAAGQTGSAGSPASRTARPRPSSSASGASPPTSRPPSRCSTLPIRPPRSAASPTSSTSPPAAPRRWASA
jgi:hypothetical protein